MPPETAAAPQKSKAEVARARRRKILEMADEGMSGAEIAEQLGVTKQRVSHIARQAGIIIGKSGGTGRVSAWIPRRLIANVGRLANDAGCSNSAMVGRVIAAAFADPAIARRLLGKDALPPRSYQRKA